MSLRSTMDAQDYDKFVDILLQFRGKIPVAGTLMYDRAAYNADRIRNVIDELIHHIDNFAYLDTMGWIK